jgi:gamma-glutamylcyclotransferase (GGCT)/AIG2-like uncharacterized protein YtfP
MASYLFVYGSLLPAFAPAGLRDVLGRLRPVGRATLPGRLYNLGPYPAAVLDGAAPTRVVGEVFALPPEPDVLAALDDYEDYDRADVAASLYLRVQQPIRLPDGTEVPCWVYVYNRDPGAAPLIAGGDYTAWRTARDNREP